MDLGANPPSCSESRDKALVVGLNSPFLEVNNSIMMRLLFAGNEFFRQLGKVLRDSVERLAVQMSKLLIVAAGVAAC